MTMYDYRLWTSALAALRPPPRPPIVEWCKANIRLPDVMAEPGPFVPTRYQAGLIEAFEDEDAEILVFEMGAQTGKSSALEAALLYMIENDPGATMLLQPTEGKVKQYVKTRFDPLINAAPTIKHLIGLGANTNGGDSNTHKSFPGGFVVTASSQKPEDLRALPIRYLFADEIDGYPSSVRQEGDPLALAMRRTATFRNRKIAMASTPTLKKTSRIDQWFRRGTMERFHIPCPECGVLDYPRFPNLKWPKGEPEKAKLECVHCGHAMSEAERQHAIELGAWHVTNESAEPNIRSFHATSLISKFETLEKIARKYEEGEGKLEEVKSFYNTFLAEPYDFGDNVTVESSAIEDAAEPFGEFLPPPIRFITCAIDTQDDRLEATIVGHGGEGEAWVLQHHVFTGSPGELAVWREADALLAATFKRKDGSRLPISASCVDSGGHHATDVANFVNSQKQKSHICVAIKGVGDRSEDGRNGYPTIWRSPNGLKKLTDLWLIGVDGVKHNVMRRVSKPKGEAGRIHFNASLEASYFEGVASEEYRVEFVKGRAKAKWVRKEGVKHNEPLDCLVYNIALATKTKPLPALPPIGARPQEPQQLSPGERLQNLYKQT